MVMIIAENRFRNLLFGKHEISSFDVYMLSDETMHDEGYTSCVGVVLLGKVYAGILHSVIGDIKQLELLVEVLSSQEKELWGIIIAGADNVANTLEKGLHQIGIPLINAYRDHFMCAALMGGDLAIERAYSQEALEHPNASYWVKEIVVSPSTQEVFMYSRRSGFVQLN